MSQYSHPQIRKVKTMLGALSAQISSVPELKKWGGRMPAPPRFNCVKLAENSNVFDKLDGFRQISSFLFRIDPDFLKQLCFHKV